MPPCCMQRAYSEWKIYYYAAVNWYTGALYIKLMTGTRGKGWAPEGYQVPGRIMSGNW